MTKIQNKLAATIQGIDLGDINETKKLALLDEVAEVLTARIILRLIEETPKDKRDLFIKKIRDNKENPDKVLLFIDYFVENADKFIDDEIKKYKKELRKVSVGKSKK